MTLRRSGPPERRSPLTSHTELSRSTGLTGGGELARTPMQRSGPPARPADPREARSGAQRSTQRSGTSRAADIPTRTRLEVYLRDEDRCGRCGRTVWSGIRSIQHRDPRGAGGGGGRRHAMSNLVTVCGLLSTDPDGCHHWCETRRIEAQASGFLVPMGIEPASWPIHLHDGWHFLTDQGDRVPTDDPNRSSA